MKGFIEVTSEGQKHLVNINHIIEVIGNTIYIADFSHLYVDLAHIDCDESYEEIAEMIAGASE